MRPKDVLDPDQKDDRADVSLLAEVLHEALERSLRSGPLPAEEPAVTGVDERTQLDTALHAARLLDQLVSHVEEGSGVYSFPEDSSTKEYVPGGKDSLPPFPRGYKVCGLLGEGTFGQVWLAEDLNLGIQVALKRVTACGGVEQRSRTLAMLRREAKILAQLKHPNVVQVHGWHQVGAEHYLVMQYVAGASLKDRLKTHGPLNWRQAARYAADAAEALQHVHESGVVHRDIKPANLLWDEAKDEVLLTDFGLSAWLAEAGRGEVSGTALYMAPESLQGWGEQPADVYGLAATLFDLITGEPPFSAPSWEELSARTNEGLPDPDPRCTSMPARLERVIRSALAPDPVCRPDLREFTATLRGCLNQLLADSLIQNPAPSSGPAVRLTVARWRSDGTYTPIAAAERVLPRLTRNMEVVPPDPKGVVLRTGDRVRIEASADHDGYLTVFNVGPKGDLSLLYPAQSDPVAVRAGERVRIVDVRVTPPAGSERVFAVWSREPLALGLAEVAREAGGEPPLSSAYRATRNLMRVEQAVKQLRGEDWEAAVVELEHQAG